MVNGKHFCFIESQEASVTKGFFLLSSERSNKKPLNVLANQKKVVTYGLLDKSMYKEHSITQFSIHEIT